MGTIYFISESGKLGKQDDALFFTSYTGNKRIIFLHETDRLIFLSGVDISSSALKLIMRHKIDTVFLNRNGLFNAKLEFEHGKNVFTRRDQFRVLENEYLQIPIVTGIVEGKLKNQLALMQKINRKTEQNTIESTINEMQKLINKIPVTKSIETLRGIEGVAAKYYFSVFKYNIKPAWANFYGRSKNPPLDNINAVLSLLYTYLYYRVDALIEAAGLDPCVGYLHKLEYSRRSLSFDLMEEFRVPLCDTLTCALFNLGILKEEDFEYKTADDVVSTMPVTPECLNSISENDAGKKKIPTFLTKTGLQKVSSQFDEKMNTLILYPPTGERISYFNVIAHQIDHFKRVLKGEEKQYKSFLIR